MSAYVRNLERLAVRALPGRFLKHAYFGLSRRALSIILGDEVIVRSRSLGEIHLSRRQFVDKFIYLFDIWEPVITRLFQNNAREGDVIIDVGANIGYYTLLSSHLVGSRGRVIAFEPSPTIFAALRKNIDRNNLTNVIAHNIGISGHSHRAPFFLSKGGKFSGNFGRSGLQMSIGSFELETEVELKPLQTMVDAKWIQKTKIIKIDVEGSEAVILESIIDMAGLLRTDCIIICESNLTPSDEGDEIRKTLATFLDLGFRTMVLPNEYNYEFYCKPLPSVRPFSLEEHGGVLDLALCRRPIVFD